MITLRLTRTRATDSIFSTLEDAEREFDAISGQLEDGDEARLLDDSGRILRMESRRPMVKVNDRTEGGGR